MVRNVMLGVASTVALVALLSRTAVSQEVVARTPCLPGLHVLQVSDIVGFPSDAIFCPLLADPKQPRSFLSLLNSSFRSSINGEDEDLTIGAIGIGDEVGLLRWGGVRPGDGIQLSLDAAVFAQFDLGTRSYDLINADYLIGLPITFRLAAFSLRLRLYHQSSHLGDEFLLRSEHPERENLSFEALQLILSQEAGPLRLYGGGELLFNREPQDLASKLVHGGLEWRAGRGAARLVAAADAKSSEEQDWKVALSARAGVELAGGMHSDHPARVWALLVEFYSGPSPYGQFFRERIRYVGVGLHLRP